MQCLSSMVILVQYTATILDNPLCVYIYICTYAHETKHTEKLASKVQVKATNLLRNPSSSIVNHPMVHCSTLGTCSRHVFWFAGRILAFQEAQPPLDFRFQMISGSSTSKPCFLKAHHPFEVFLSLERISDTRLSVSAFHKI